MFVSEFRLKGLEMDQRSKEKNMQSGEFMEEQGFGVHTSTHTHGYEVAWRRVRVHDAYAWKVIC